MFLRVSIFRKIRIISFKFVFTAFARPPFVNGFHSLFTATICAPSLPLTRSPNSFPFTWLLHVFNRLLFLIYMVFTCFSQAPFFHLHVFFYMFLTGPLFRLHGFYRVTNITFPEFLQYSVKLFTRFSHG